MVGGEGSRRQTRQSPTTLSWWWDEGFHKSGAVRIWQNTDGDLWNGLDSASLVYTKKSRAGMDEDPWIALAARPTLGSTRLRPACFAS